MIIIKATKKAEFHLLSTELRQVDTPSFFRVVRFTGELKLLYRPRKM